MTDERDGDQLIGDVFPKREVIEVPEATKKEWAPWHKPRKQWLRDHQWVKEISPLITTKRPLKYFSLPGEDLLDFRVMAAFCKENQILLQCVGFNEPDFEKNLSPAKIAKARQQILEQRSFLFNEYGDTVHPLSDVHFDDFKEISDKDTQAYRFIENKGPFDVVNLDLCNSFSGENRDEALYKATYNLLSFQNDTQRRPWLLLLTTRADHSKVNKDDFENFWQLLIDNVSKSQNFKRGIEEDILGTDFSRVVPSKCMEIESPKFEKLFGICICKWLLGVMGSSDAWNLKLQPCYWYRTKSATNADPNMLSLAICFEPVSGTISDPTGLGSTQPPMTSNETASALQILDSFAQITDVDSLLEKNASDLEESIEKTEKLLKSAGYDVSTYRNWVVENLPSTT